MSSNNTNTNENNEYLPVPVGVILEHFNTTEFIILVQNITTNLTIAQENLVMTEPIQMVPAIGVSVRIVLILFDMFLIVLVFLLRRQEPVKSKLGISLMVLLINIICHIQGIVEILPAITLHFQSYWNQFILEKYSNQMDAATFYRNNLNSFGVPKWLESYALSVNIYCFFDTYLIFGCAVAGFSIYSIQLIKLMLLLLLKERKQEVVNSLEEFKKRQVEKAKQLKESNNSSQDLTKGQSVSLIRRLSKKILSIDTRETSTSTMENSSKPLDESPVPSVSSVSSSPSNIIPLLDSASLQQTNTHETPLTPRQSKPTDTDDPPSLVYEEIAIDLSTDDDALSTSYDEISKKGKLINFLKKVLKYQVIEIVYIGFWLIVWFIIVTIVIILRGKDTWSDLFISWDSYSGYCRNSDRIVIGYFSIIIFFIIFLFIPITLTFDFVTSLVRHRKLVRINREKGKKTDNFIIYYFYETDPFVYRSEVLALIIIDTIVIIAFLIVAPDGTVVLNLGQKIASSLIISIGLNFAGGIVCNPGITIIRALWNYFTALRTKVARKGENSNAIRTIQQLISSPICSETIDFVLSHKTERDLFYRYLKEEYSTENLLFTEDISKLRKINSSMIRAKIMKIKEISKLYLSENDSIFEINVPTKLIQKELTNYYQLMNLMDELGLKASALPRVMKESSNSKCFNNIDPTKDELVKSLIANLTSPQIFSEIQREVYKNLMDSYYRFNNSRAWKEYLKNVK